MFRNYFSSHPRNAEIYGILKKRIDEEFLSKENRRRRISNGNVELERVCRHLPE